jgi:hypothetical protein
MRIATVPARTGLSWLRESFAIFVKQPLAFGSILFAYLVLSILASIVPIVGQLAPMLLAPFVALAYMHGARMVLAGKTPWPTELAAALSGRKGLGARLLQLGLVCSAAFFLAFAASALLDGGTMWKLATSGGSFDGTVRRSPGLMEGALLSLLLLMLMSLLLCVAPGLVGFDGYPVAKAVFASAMVALYNWRALLLFLVAGIVTVYLILSVAGIVLIALLRDPVSAQLALVPLFLMLVTPLIVALYPIYRDTLIREGEPA